MRCCAQIGINPTGSVRVRLHHGLTRPRDHHGGQEAQAEITTADSPSDAGSFNCRCQPHQYDCDRCYIRNGAPVSDSQLNRTTCTATTAMQRISRAGAKVECPRAREVEAAVLQWWARVRTLNNRFRRSGRTSQGGVCTHFRHWVSRRRVIVATGQFGMLYSGMGFSLPRFAIILSFPKLVAMPITPAKMSPMQSIRIGAADSPSTATPKTAVPAADTGPDRVACSHW